jgi:glucokinase
MTTLLVDAGGTNIRSAWTDGGFNIWDEQDQAADTFKSLGDALSSRFREDQIRPYCAIVAVAGPVKGDHVQFTNRSWGFSHQQLKAELGLKQLIVINDFAAVALALPVLKPAQLDVVKTGASAEQAAMLAIGPGTGLGISCVVPVDNTWVAVPGEGGHSAAALDRLVPSAAQQRLWDSGWLPWEAILSGPGLVRLHGALHCSHELETPEQVTFAAASGDEFAQQTLWYFAALLGRCAADTALVVGAWGGVFLAGGMIKAMGDLFNREAFLEGFEVGREPAKLIHDIGVSIITDPYPAFTGLMHAASEISDSFRRSNLGN